MDHAAESIAGEKLTIHILEKTKDKGQIRLRK